MKHRSRRILPLALIIFLCSFCLSLGVNAQPWNGGTASAFASGRGTQSDPYVIENADQLSYLAKSVNSSKTYNGVYFVLANDIALNDESFTFDSDTGLVKVSDGTNTAYLGTGIKGDGSKSNAVFDTVASEAGAWYKSDTSKTKGAYAGTINTWTPIGNSKVRFEGNFDGKDYTVSGIYINNTLDYGGLFGCTSADLENIKVTSSYIHAGEFTGAIVGSNLYSTKGCAVNAIVCSDQNNVGGVIGFGGTVTESFSTCIVRGAQFVGGIAGSARVEKCSNNGDVFGDISVGGIVGGGHGLDNVNTASVFGTESVGGICGSISTNHTITTSYNSGAVYGEKYVGAVLGRLVKGSVANCYYLKGCATDSSNKVQNGLGAVDNGSSRADVGGVTCGLDDSQIKLKESFAGFDFENVWTVSSDGVPTLASMQSQLHTHIYDNACDADCNICAQTRDIAHSYKTEWSTDQTSHWHECSVCFYKKDTAAHKPGSAATETTPQICTVCSYVITPALGHTHKYSNAWSYDSVSHWYACSCGEKQGVLTHRYDNSCDTVCNDCGYVRTITHNYKTEWSTDQTSHWHECSVCFYKKDTAAHKPGAAATETTPQICTACSYVITPALGHTHKYSNAWSYDSVSHWYACSCGEKQSVSTHRYDNSCDTVCNDCGYVRTVTHSYKIEWSTDQASHWHECSVCFYKKDASAHKPGAAATETTPQICTVCSYVITPAIGHTHSYSDVWSKDGTNHWHECACGNKGDLEKHEYDNDCDTTCNGCGHERTAKHSYGEIKQYDDKSHWFECSVCLDKKQAEIHIFDNLCDTTCNGCGYTRKINHVYSGDWSSDADVHWRECVLCKTQSEATPHSWDSGVVTKEPTKDEEGIRTYKCSDCSYTQNEPIAKLPSVNTGTSTTTSTPVTTEPVTTTGTTGVTEPSITTVSPETTPSTQYDGNDSGDSGNGYFILAVVLGVISIILLIAFLIMLLYVLKKKK